MEQAAQVKKQPVWLDNLEKRINFISKKIPDCMEQSLPASQASLISILIHFYNMPIQVGQAVNGDIMLL